MKVRLENQDVEHGDVCKGACTCLTNFAGEEMHASIWLPTNQVTRLSFYFFSSEVACILY